MNSKNVVVKVPLNMLVRYEEWHILELYFELEDAIETARDAVTELFMEGKEALPEDEYAAEMDRLWEARGDFQQKVDDFEEELMRTFRTLAKYDRHLQMHTRGPAKKQALQEHIAKL